ncbi:hypothetical protein C1Y40_01721 [Mycobacterium talmoniae]|uniref:Uncharacterized protein n=1 Tax=Mycobacterium talmoniae TaxID=1858794 RepID=A0A2S8BN33_9MYCO|nr:hypothetical protein C1Y40_01721 [Mycobacterium talmoniae]
MQRRPGQRLARTEPPDRVPLGVVGGQQRRVGRPGQHRRQFPGQVVGALDRAVGSPGLERRHGVRRVADQKDAAAAEFVGHPLVGLPGRDVDDLDVDGLPDRRGDEIAAAVGGELRRGLPPAGKVGGGEHAEVVTHRQHDAVHRGVLDLHGVTVAEAGHELPPRCPKVDEDDVDRQGPEAGGRDAQRVADRAVHPVGGDQIVGAHGLGRARIPVAHDGGDAGVVLLERAQLGAVAHLAAAPANLRQQHGLECALRAVLPGRFGAQPVERREDRVDVEGLPLFGAGQRRLGQHVRNPAGDGVHLVAEPQPAQDFQAAKAQVAGLRVDEHLAPLFDQHRTDAVLGQQGGHRQPGRARADDERRNPLVSHRHLRPRRN